MTCIIIDGNNMAYRVRYTYSLSNRNEDTSVLYGFIISIQSEIKKHNADSVIVCWDKGVPEYRKELFPEYKANRHKDDEAQKDFWDDFRRQMNELKKFISYLGVVSVSVEGYEADDLLYSTAKLVLGDVVIVSTDNDILQTVDHRISVHNPVKKFTVTASNFQDIVGVESYQYIDYKIMTGDSSDNVEGIRGIGEKTALDILYNYSSLKNAISCLNDGEEWKSSKLAKTRLLEVDRTRIQNLERLFDLSKPDWEMVCDLYDSIDEWIPYDGNEANKFLLRHSFVSLMGGKLRERFGSLKKPEYCNSEEFTYGSTSNTSGRILVWFSCGAASACAAKITLQKYPDAEIIYCDTLKYEHPDNLRFIKDVERWLGKKVIILKSEKYEDIFDVFEKTGWIVGHYGARCTTELKRNVREKYQRANDIHVFGYTADEEKRIARFIDNNTELKLMWPLLDENFMKQDCLNMLMQAGIDLPIMYKKGYKNNNCIGCVKGGKGYWNKIRKDFPEAFTRMAAFERKSNFHILRDYFLDELPEDVGRYESEYEIECGPACNIADKVNELRKVDI